MVRRSALEAIGGFCEDYFLNYEDIDLCLRLRQRGWRTYYTPDVEVVHHVGGSSEGTVTPLVLRERRRSHLIYFAKHRSPLSFTVVRALNRAVCALNAHRDRMPGREFWRSLGKELGRGSRASWRDGARGEGAAERPR